MKAGLCHVVQRGLDGGHGLMDLRRAVVPSGVMVASTTGKMKIMHILILKMAWWFDGDDRRKNPIKEEPHRHLASL
jgi:hypothetical protein